MSDVYRYSVKCDRTRNDAIERAAKSTGLSSTAFVQAHFDSILAPSGDPPPQAPVRPPVKPVSRQDYAFAKTHDLRAGAVRLYRVMLDLTENGVCEAHYDQLAHLAGLAPRSAQALAIELIKAGLIRRLSRADAGMMPVFHILTEKRS